MREDENWKGIEQEGDSGELVGEKETWAVGYRNLGRATWEAEWGRGPQC